MRLRLVVVAAFAGMLLASGYLAYVAGVLPGPAQAVADSASSSGAVTRVTPLGWLDEPLGLAAGRSSVLWERRDPGPGIAGIWAYDTVSGYAGRLLGRGQTGKAAGSPAAAGDLVTWSAWKSERGEGPARVEAYDRASERRWTIAPAGRTPLVAGHSVLWIDRDGAGALNDVIRGSDSVTDEVYALETGGRIRRIAATRDRVAWISDKGEKRGLWAGSYRAGDPRRLAKSAAAVALSGDRVVWAAAGSGTTRLTSWDRETKETTVLREMDGEVSALRVAGGYAVWVTTREDSRPQVWVYDFARGEAFAASPADGRQASPVVVAGSVYWADDRDGDWALYRRLLDD